MSPFDIKVRCEPVPAPTIVRLLADADRTAFAFINLARDLQPPPAL